MLLEEAFPFNNRDLLPIIHWDAAKTVLTLLGERSSISMQVGGEGSD